VGARQLVGWIENLSRKKREKKAVQEIDKSREQGRSQL
jgi:hypothetical protein